MYKSMKVTNQFEMKKFLRKKTNEGKKRPNRKLVGWEQRGKSSKNFFCGRAVFVSN